MGRAPQRIPLGGQQVAVPTLTGVVGAPGPAYPAINAATAVAQVSGQFARIAELRNAPRGAGGVTPEHLAVALAVSRYRDDLAGAIAGFQRSAHVGSSREVADRVMVPGGPSWPALFGYGRMASELETLRDRSVDPRDYVYSGRFDHARFRSEASARLAADRATATRFDAGSLDDYDTMLGSMEIDARIIDIRWMAYMFATAFWEAAEVRTTGHRPNGRPIRHWRTVTPIDESGHGVPRAYARPVKVERLGPTHARITEWDGDVIEVTERGYTLGRGQDGGANYNSPASATYAAATGDEHSYYGRGYVQLTWWYNYAAASVAIGRNFDLLWDPELAKVPDVAYAVMADGMISGRHFANGRRLQNYIFAGTANYAGARAIVNAHDPQPTIVAAARIFEAALLAARR